MWVALSNHAVGIGATGPMCGNLDTNSAGRQPAESARVEHTWAIGGAVPIPRIWSKHDQTFVTVTGNSCVCSGRTDLKKLALEEAHIKRRRYAACGSFTHRILLEKGLFSQFTLQKVGEENGLPRWNSQNLQPLLMNWKAKCHLATHSVSSNPYWFQSPSVPFL